MYLPADLDSCQARQNRRHRRRDGRCIIGFVQYKTRAIRLNGLNSALFPSGVYRRVDLYDVSYCLVDARTGLRWGFPGLKVTELQTISIIRVSLYRVLIIVVSLPGKHPPETYGMGKTH